MSSAERNSLARGEDRRHVDVEQLRGWPPLEVGGQGGPREKATVQHSLEGGEGVNQIAIQGKSIPSRKTHQCKGPEAGTCPEEQ